MLAPLPQSRPLTAESENTGTYVDGGSAGKCLDVLDDAVKQLAEDSLGSRGNDEVPLSVVVPVYNERDTLPIVLERIDAVDIKKQIVIVDDGSTDGTSQWLANLPKRPDRVIIRRRRNRGKGAALRIGFRHTVGQVVAIQDADLEYDPADLIRIVDPILTGDAEVVYGSRYIENSQQDHSWFHRAGNRFLTVASNRMTGLQLTDMETCRKAFQGDLIRSLPVRESRFGVEPELTAKIARRKARVIEVPIRYHGRGYDEGKKIGWRDAIAALWCILRYSR